VLREDDRVLGKELDALACPSLGESSLLIYILRPEFGKMKKSLRQRMRIRGTATEPSGRR
jgi:hypothetical protein